MTIPVYAVSLAGHAERRRHIAEECAKYGVAVEIVDAADMRCAEEDDIRHLCVLPSGKPEKKRRFLTAGELGCALSHRSVYGKMAERGQDYALVLEDDAHFVRPPAVLLDEENLRRIQEQYPFDVLIVGYVKTLPEHLPYYYRRIPVKRRAVLPSENGDLLFGTPWEQYACGTVAYIISGGGAKLLAAQDVCVTADDWLYFEQEYGLRVLHCRPAFVLEELVWFDSTIRQERAGFLQPKLSSVVVRSVKGWLKNIAMNYLGLKK